MAASAKRLQRQRVWRWSWLYPWLLAACVLTGCDSGAPDLAQLYKSSRNNQPPVVVIPGIMGSKFYDQSSGEEIWPGSWYQLLTGDYSELKLEIDPATLQPRLDDLSPKGLTDKVAGKDFYGGILDTLENYGGYQRLELGEKPLQGRRHYYVFAYDFRQDNVVSAAKLADFIAQIRKDHQRPDLTVDIVAHSMGGLIARYFLRYGREDVLDDNNFPVNGYGRSRVRRVVLLGTPNFGSILAFHRLNRGLPLGLGTISVEVLASMPSIYQLLPHALSNWLIDENGQPLDEDIFAASLWRQHAWSVFAQQDAVMHSYFEKRIERARRFAWSLSVPFPDAEADYIVFGGNCQNTPNKVMLEHGKLRLLPEDVAQPLPELNYPALMMVPGDGVVTKPSLLARNDLDPTVARHRYSYFPLAYSFFLCEAHDQLTGNISFQDNLLNALLSIQP